MTSAQSTHKQRTAAREAVSCLCCADYELACAVTALESAGHPAAEQAEALFQTVLAFRQGIEAEVNG